MEQDNFQKLKSPRLLQQDFQEQLKRVSEIAAVAKDKQDYRHAHDPIVLTAIKVVEKFLRKSGRICYGGQALNAHLPKAYQFYDPDKTVPDYDFFTPNQDQDIIDLVKAFQTAGFQDISVRLGIHEGTFKIYVNYFPVADITQMEPALYSLLSERKYVKDKISYLDADTLRMLIYLELSRPKGEVERWDKIYERLLLLDYFVPLGEGVNASGSPTRRSPSILRNPLTKYESTVIFKYILNNGRIFAGADLVDLYSKSLTHKRLAIGHRYPIILFAKDILKEGELIKDILQDAVVEEARGTKIIQQVNADMYSGVNGDMLPAMIILYKGKKVAVVIIEETACHSYYNYVLPSSETMKIASIDTLVTLYFALGIRGKGAQKTGDQASIAAGFERLARQLVYISRESRADPRKFPFPFLSLECEGEQTSYESLIREKVKRMQRESVRNRLRRLRNLAHVKSGNVSRKRLNKTVKNKT